MLQLQSVQWSWLTYTPGSAALVTHTNMQQAKRKRKSALELAVDERWMQTERRTHCVVNELLLATQLPVPRERVRVAAGEAAVFFDVASGCSCAKLWPPGVEKNFWSVILANGRASWRIEGRIVGRLLGHRNRNFKFASIESVHTLPVLLVVHLYRFV